MIGSILLSLMVFFGLTIIVLDATLRITRLQQIFGLFALLYWYFVLLLSPLSKLTKKNPKMAAILFTRKAFGVMVAYFALLHAGLGFFGQLEGWRGIGLLPVTFKVALVFGLSTLLVLLFMAALSLNFVVKLTRFKAWKQLSRISYLAGLVAIVHVWMIGSHVSLNLLQLLAFEGLVALFGLEAWRLGKQLVLGGWKASRAVMLAICLWLSLSLGLVVMRIYVPSYSKNHSTHAVLNGAVIHGNH